MFFYTLGIFFYRLMLGLVSPFHSKAKKMLLGRKALKEQLRKISSLRGNKKLIWFHVASLGEFEQGKPVLEKLKQRFPDAQILLTFFSPSGYDIQKDYKGADYVIYIPFDFPKQVRKFLDAVRPDCAIFVKYEFWLNFLYEMHKRKIPVYLISAVFHGGQPFFRWYGNKFIKALSFYKHIYVQDKSSFQLLRTLNVKTISVSGDTRFDRVIEIASSSEEIAGFRKFSENNFVVVAGSSYEREENYLVNSFLKLKEAGRKVKLIIAPHNVNEVRISQIRKLLEESKISFCLFTEGIQEEKEVVVLNTIGKLSVVYRYGQLAFIGGGFSDGIHSILEAAVYGLPVIFGPEYHKFNEAHSMLENGSAFVIKNETELTERLEKFSTNSEELSRVSQLAAGFVKNSAGAAKLVSENISF